MHGQTNGRQRQRDYDFNQWDYVGSAMSSVTDLDDSLHHAHHLVDDGNDFVRPLRWRHVGPVRRQQHVAAGHIQDISG